MGIRNVIKRDGHRVPFDENKIKNAVMRAFSNVYIKNSEEKNEKAAKHIADNVTKIIEGLKVEELNVEEIQDLVEKELMEADANVAKAYILYRHKHAQVRLFKSSLGISDDLKLPINSLIILSARYLLKNENGKIIETPKQLFERVATSIANVEKKYGKNDKQILEISKEFYNAMTSFKFMPNSPTLMNAGTKLGQLSACFVIPIADSINDIFDAVKYAAIVHKSGGGTGFSFSRLRPSNDAVNTTGGVASGPISFMKIFDSATEQIKQGGKRRGANMGILRIDHPDILNFIMAKENENTLRNFNLSIAITKDFMNALSANRQYDLINPRNGKGVGKLNARAVWNLIVTMAWKTGDPGLVFIDRINSSYSNPVPRLGPIESTNPCGEQPLYAYDSCNLGSINLVNMLKPVNNHFEVDWDELRRITKLGIRFLDNVIDANTYPIKQIEEMTRSIRRVGIGVMGWADMLIKLGIRYDSNEALALAENVMSFITNNARQMSQELAEERGAFPEFKNSIWYKLGYKPLRNSTVTTIAPTGTISIISNGVSQGIEPIFSVVYLRNVAESLGSNLIEVNNEFERYALENNFYSDDLMKKLAGKISIQDVEEIPDKIRRLFVTAHDIAPEWHIKMQAAFQKHVDNAVSKTINFPSQATPQDIENAYKLAYELGCKGITVYRDQSKSNQVLNAVNEKNQMTLKSLKDKHAGNTSITNFDASTYVISAAKEKPCPECGTEMIAGEGCFTCPRCGFSLCD
ncbi:MAG: adenosylcobalamin-dependent ribonucleoside-diphosphate reductase [Candidatus Marsarchaeota archaeon]|nr:adenosylcobalamin-dependent ribonucleoside-diphosphate reductase [Candidatus Marsarchaeota archaeon]